MTAKKKRPSVDDYPEMKKDMSSQSNIEKSGGKMRNGALNKKEDSK